MVFYEHFFHIKRLRIVSPIKLSKSFTKDQPILSESSQVILVPYDNIENNSNNNHELKDQPVLNQLS